MLKELQKPLNKTFWLMDLLIIASSFSVIHYLRYGSVGFFNSEPEVNIEWATLMNLIAWAYLSKCYRLYNSKRLVSFVREAKDVGKVTLSAMVIASFPILLIARHSVDPWEFLGALALQISYLILFRFSLRKALRYIRSRGYNSRNVVIIGSNARAARLAKEVEETPELGIKILGYVDAPNGDNHCGYLEPYKLLGSVHDVKRILTEEVVDEVFITLPIKSFYSQIESIIQLCETVGIEAKISTELFNLHLAKSTISQYFNAAFIDLYTSPKLSWELMLKRIMDVSISSMIVVLLFPILLVVGLLIKATSKGPVFFRQQRVGYNGRIFTLYKFRTMVENAEALKHELWELNEMDGPVFKIRNDPRVTRIGRVLRKTSIDEIPQLINVLRGDMSLVGPRPPLPSEVNQYDLKDRRRLSMKPGITGIWQVCGRNVVPFEEWMEMDRQYIDQWCLWLDLKILTKTVPAVLRGTGSV